MQDSIYPCRVGPMFFPRANYWLALPISKKSAWNKFMGETLGSLAGTLRGSAPLVVGVTTLGDCGKIWDSMMLAGADGFFRVFNLAWCFCGLCCSCCCLLWGVAELFFNTDANVVNTVIVSSPIVVKRHIWIGVFQSISHVLSCNEESVHRGYLRH